MKREQVKRPVRQRKEEEPEELITTEYEVVKKDLDDLLDEVDSVLEENAEEFVSGYIQKGGE